ncbi:LLM class F420-dependent oxidoreductase [Streptomyces verrucosisporus]|uniref:LLM class F420-dependent oxidoreductase n=1 Tax=Streptomyces verrucosisporus TaxID=1695161 RepID=UPI0019D27B47|nr:LLM class F420-dependent oxidoreductase [Streptomyces verrucosisporus]MBN3931300.1 LLM class F420-dependent oxidoreductase [Streptomyces verrucosisporus]
MTRPFRFGVNLVALGSRDAWRAKCRRAEELGYDVLLVPDHLGAPAPFPALVAAAEATRRPRVGTFVLNAGLWNPVLLAREVATCDRLTGGRLELGLGTGYVRSEHERAGLPWGSPGERVAHLEHTVAELDRLLSDPEHVPAPRQRPRPPLLIGGNGDRVLRLAARHADIAAFTGVRQAPGAPEGVIHLIGPGELEERTAAYRRFAAGREEPAELNYLVQRVVVTDDRRAVARELVPYALGATEDDLLEHPALLTGSIGQIAGQVRAHRERYGFGYICVLEPYMEVFAEVIEELRGG